MILLCSFDTPDDLGWYSEALGDLDDTGSMLGGDVELHAMAHVKYLVHLVPRCTALLLDQLEEWWNSKHIILDHVLAFDEV